MPNRNDPRNNLFITQHFDWNRPSSWRLRWFNKILSIFSRKTQLVSAQSTGSQTSLEQRINLYGLASQVLAYDVPGDFVEIGCHEGSTAVLLQRAIADETADRQLHLYDAFQASTPAIVLTRFQELELPAPNIHVGLFEATLPHQLPDAISFAHVDANWGQPFDVHRNLVSHCLKSLYPRLVAGAICVVSDYCVPDIYERQGFTRPWIVAGSQQWNLYPAVREACDSFLADKPEKMTLLFGGPYSHGYFRKLPVQPATSR